MRLVLLLLSLLLVDGGNAIAKSPALGENRVPRLSLPLDCIPSKTCFIQNHVDLDPGPGMVDYSCGKAGYNGHKGVDFRVISRADMLRGVKVLAAAPGRVIGIRDGIADRRVRTDADRARIKGKDCGNGVSIAHRGGMVTNIAICAGAA